MRPLFCLTKYCINAILKQNQIKFFENKKEKEMLIATLPAVHQYELLEKIISHSLIGGVRYNAGVCSAYSAKETLEKVFELATRFNKKLWVDLKGRQLRITKWAAPNYGKIILNHEIEVDLPARVYFRGDEWSELKFSRGNEIYVDPPPRYAVGDGQAINIHAENENIKIIGYLTEEDYKYIGAAREIGINNFMLSFVESVDDINEMNVAINHREAELVLKIESKKGLILVDNIDLEIFRECVLMAACDDLMINIGENKTKTLSAIEQIILKDSKAIAASRIFTSLENGNSAALADFSHLRLLQIMGYKNFMLSDGICWRYFDKAIRAWRDFQEIFCKKEGGYDE